MQPQYAADGWASSSGPTGAYPLQESGLDGDHSSTHSGEPPADGAGGRRIGDRSPRWAIVAVSALVIAGIVLLGRQLFPVGSQSAGPSTAPSHSATKTAAVTPLPIESASLWQASTSDENCKTVENTITGASRRGRPSPTGDGPKMKLKHGTGIIYDLGSVRKVTSVTVRIGAPEATLQLMAAEQTLRRVPEVEDERAPPGSPRWSAKRPRARSVTLRAKPGADPLRPGLVHRIALPGRRG